MGHLTLRRVLACGLMFCVCVCACVSLCWCVTVLDQNWGSRLQSLEARNWFSLLQQPCHVWMVLQAFCLKQLVGCNFLGGFFFLFRVHGYSQKLGNSRDASPVQSEFVCFGVC